MNRVRRLVLGRDVPCVPDEAGATHLAGAAGRGLQDTAAAVVAHGAEADGDIRISTMTTSACAVS